MAIHRDPARLVVVALRAVARSARWLILLLALYTAAFSLPRLEVWPDGWKIPVRGIIEDRIGIGDETVACIALASLVLSYWGAREGKETAADLARIAGFLFGLPWAATLVDWVAKGLAIMLKTIRRKAIELIRDEARAEEAAKWQAWLGRRVESNPDLLDENDPPPAPPSGK